VKFDASIVNRRVEGHSRIIAMRNVKFIAAVAVVAVALVAWRYAASDGSSSRVLWEYKFERLTLLEIEGGKDGRPNFVKNLDRLGRECWELTAIQPAGYSVEVSSTTNGKVVEDREFDCYFKRPK
jgi:hypothetical protein